MKGCIVPYLDKTKSREAAEDGSDGGRNLEVTAVTVYLAGCGYGDLPGERMTALLELSVMLV